MWPFSWLKDRIFGRKELPELKPLEIEPGAAFGAPQPMMPSAPYFPTSAPTFTDMQIIISKLDLINARLENLNYRITNLERLAQQAQQPERRW